MRITTIKIIHLCVDNYVFQSIGYTDSHHPDKYVYLIHGNLGDIYKVEGYQKNLGKVLFNKDGYSVEINSYLLDVPKIAKYVKLLVDSWSK